MTGKLASGPTGSLGPAWKNTFGGSDRTISNKYSSIGTGSGDRARYPTYEGTYTQFYGGDSTSQPYHSSLARLYDSASVFNGYTSFPTQYGLTGSGGFGDEYLLTSSICTWIYFINPDNSYSFTPSSTGDKTFMGIKTNPGNYAYPNYGYTSTKEEMNIATSWISESFEAVDNRSASYMSTSESNVSGSGCSYLSIAGYSPNTQHYIGYSYDGTAGPGWISRYIIDGGNTGSSDLSVEMGTYPEGGQSSSFAGDSYRVPGVALSQAGAEGFTIGSRATIDGAFTNTNYGFKVAHVLCYTSSLSDFQIQSVINSFENSPGFTGSLNTITN